MCCLTSLFIQVAGSKCLALCWVLGYDGEEGGLALPSWSIVLTSIFLTCQSLIDICIEWEPLSNWDLGWGMCKLWPSLLPRFGNGCVFGGGGGGRGGEGCRLRPGRF